MNNQLLAVLQNNVGKPFSSSPSPFMHWLKPEVVSAQEGHLVFKYLVRAEMTNPIGTLHGGVTAAIIDDIMGATLATFGEPVFYTTINLNVDFFSSAYPGEYILAEAMLVKKGRQFVNATCKIWNEDKSRLLAQGYSNLFKTELKK